MILSIVANSSRDFFTAVRPERRCVSSEVEGHAVKSENLYRPASLRTNSLARARSWGETEMVSFTGVPLFFLVLSYFSAFWRCQRYRPQARRHFSEGASFRCRHAALFEQTETPALPGRVVSDEKPQQERQESL